MAAAQASDSSKGSGYPNHNTKLVTVRILSPQHGGVAGVGGAGWVVDLSMTYKAGLRAAGFTAPQLTG